MNNASYETINELLTVVQVALDHPILTVIFLLIFIGSAFGGRD